MINILYDNQVFTWQNCGGISRSFVEIISNLDNDINYKLPICFSNNIYLHDSKITIANRFLPTINFRGKDKIIKIVNQSIINKSFSKDFDIFHPTYFDPYFLNKIGKKPFVLTIHDMIPEKFPQFFPANFALQNNKKLLAEKSTKIIAVSEMTKNDIVDLYKINPDKISVIYHGSSLAINTIKTLKLPKDYILFIGVRSDYKNFKTFFSAYVRINTKYKDVFLICTGNQFTDEEKKLFASFGVLDKVLHFFVDDSKLSELYCSAKLFVFPSFYEGFGIPILEAFASGCPVLLSNIDCFQEVAQKAALYFDPLNVDSIYETISFAIENESVREQIVNLGFERLKIFTWEKAGGLVSNLYKSI